MLVTTRATVQGRAGFGLRSDTPVFPGERGEIHAPERRGVGPAPPDGGLDLGSSARFQLAPTVSVLT
ncbi:MAG: hypothetical protein O3A13_14280 [Proteobacteria bacterium]|nr:hypothetical protein [Pseudomonadota bacterium]